MKSYDKFLQIRDYVDDCNICDLLSLYFCDDEMEEFCNFIEDHYQIKYDDFNQDYDD